MENQPKKRGRKPKSKLIDTTVTQTNNPQINNNDIKNIFKRY